MTDEEVIDSIDDEPANIPHYLISKNELGEICKALKEEGSNPKLADYIYAHIVSQPNQTTVADGIESFISQFGSPDGISKLTDKIKNSDVANNSGFRKVVWLAIIGGVGILIYLFGKSIVGWFSSSRVSRDQIAAREGALTGYVREHNRNRDMQFDTDARQPRTKDWWL